MASWFYLTLWRGTPSNATDFSDSEIVLTDQIGGVLMASDSIDTCVVQTDMQGIDVEMTDNASTTIVTANSNIVNVQERNEVTIIAGTNN